LDDPLIGRYMAKDWRSASRQRMAAAASGQAFRRLP
jgi:hypothetical protein